MLALIPTFILIWFGAKFIIRILQYADKEMRNNGIYNSFKSDQPSGQQYSYTEDTVQTKPKVTSFKELYDYEHEEFKLDK